ncbi:MAG: RHS repeat-associated core domain-containing protein, partial [Phycisphaerae bacterium]|nr:RHS repeat-associated core domain-containing protein [Phycisphaerae bacterium]
SRPRSSAASGESRVHERILMRDVTTGTEYYYLPEEMHTISALANADGALVESYRYDVYGKVTMTGSHGEPIEQSGVGNPYFFTGRWLDFYSDSAGHWKQFYDYRARTYDPENGRFLQRDPTGYADGSNLYEAFGSNPARFVDPMGLAEELAYRAGCAFAFSERDYNTVVAVEERAKNWREPSETELGVADAIGELPVEFVVCTYTAIRHPIRTGSAIGEAAATTYCNSRACGDCRVVAVLQTGAAGAGSVTGLGEIVTAIEEPGTPREKAKHFTKGVVQFVLIVFPLAKAGVVGKAGTVTNTLDDVGRAGVNSLDDVGRAGVNVVDDAVRAGTGTVDDAARAAGAVPPGTVPPAIGEQLLFDFVRQDAASATAKNGLLRGEGLVGTYDDLISLGIKGDSITPHHIPSAKHMSAYGVERGEGIAINMEQGFLRRGGRHRSTFTYGTAADAGLPPRQALARGVWDVRRIYQEEGLYGPYMRGQLREVIRQNRLAHAGLFEKR